MYFLINRDIKSKYEFLNRDYIYFNPKSEFDNYLKNLNMIEIEVFSYCNKKCWFCPNCFIDRRSQNVQMDESIYLSILNELVRYNFKGFISFSRYNEPFSNKIIFERIDKARKLLPMANLISFTNGDYINHDILIRTEALGLNSIFIQMYEDFNKARILNLITQRMKTLNIQLLPIFISKKKIKFGGYLKKLYIEIQARDYSKVGKDRGGTIKQLIRNQKRKLPCMIPFFNIYIDFNGNVVPCCNIRSDIDQHKKYIIGNIYEGGLKDIFFSRKACNFRKSLLNFDTKKIIPCKYCNFEAIVEASIEYKFIKQKINTINMPRGYK